MKNLGLVKKYLIFSLKNIQIASTGYGNLLFSLGLEVKKSLKYKVCIN